MPPVTTDPTKNVNINSAVKSGGLTLDNAPITPPTVPAPVSTSAPKVTTPVVSSSLATDHINNVVVPTMNQAQTAIQTQQTQRMGAGTDKFGNAINIPVDDKGKPIAPTPATPEQQILDTPDTGYKFVYNPADGTRTQIPLTESASQYGMVDNNPTVAPIKPVLGSADLPSGTSIKQYNDGTYGMFDVSGKYIGNATATQFTNAKNGQDVLDKLNQAVNGNYPLNANQTAQINNIRQFYTSLISKQEKENANLTGGTTVAQNLYGIGNTMMAQGQIKGVIDDGVAKIADLTSKMNSDVAKMTEAFQSGNLADLKAAYTAFSGNAKDLQDSINKTHDDAAAIVKQHEQDQATAQNAITNDINTALAEGAKGNATPEQMRAAQTAAASKDYNGVITALGTSLSSAGGDLGEYNQYKREGGKGGIMDFLAKKANVTRANIAAVSGMNLPSSTISVINAGGGSTEVLNSLAPMDKATVQSILNYTKDPKNLSLRQVKGEKQSEREKFLALAHLIDPAYDETQYGVRNKTRQSFTSGLDARNITSLNTAVSHLSELQKAADGLGNAKWQAYNSIGNFLQKQTGNPNVVRFNNAATAVESELASVFKGMGATDQEIKQWRDNLSSSQSPDQLKEGISEAITLMGGRLSALSNKYQEGMGKPVDFEMLSDKSRGILKDMGYDPEAIDPTVQTNSSVGSDVAKQEKVSEDQAKTKVVDFGNSHPDLRPQMIKMQNDKMSYSDILNWVNQQH